MCSGTPMSGEDPSPLSVAPHNKGYYFLLASQLLIAPAPSSPLSLLTPHHLLSSPSLPALRFGLFSYCVLLSSPLMSPFSTMLSASHLLIPFFIAVAKFNSELIHLHCALGSLCQMKRSLCPLFLDGTILYIGEVQRHKSRLTMRASS